MNRLLNKISKKRRGSSQSVDNATPPTKSDELDRTGKSKKAQTIQLLEQLRELRFLRAEASRQQPEQARNDKFTRFLSEVTKEFRKLRDIHNAAFQEAFKEEDRLFDTKENARERLFAELQSNYKQMFQDTRAHFVDIATNCLQERERIRHEGQVEMNENYKILRRYLLRRFNEFLAIKAAAVGISESELEVVVMRIGPPPGEPGSYYWSLNSKPHTSVGVLQNASDSRGITGSLTGSNELQHQQVDSKVIVSGQSRSLLNDIPNGICPRSARHPDDFAAMSDGIGAISNVEHAPNAASPPDHMLISSLNDLPNGTAKVADHLTTSTQSAIGVSSTIVTPQSRIPTSAHKTQQIEEERLFLEAHTRRDILFERSEAERESGAQTRQLEFEAFQGRSEQSFLWMQDKRQRSFEARINHRDGGEKTRVERFRVLQTQLQTIFEGDLEAKLEEAQHWIGPNKWRERIDSLFDYMNDVVQRTLEESINSILRFPVNSVAALTSARSRPEDNFVPATLFRGINPRFIKSPLSKMRHTSASSVNLEEVLGFSFRRTCMQLKAPEKSRRKVFKMQALTHMTQFSINEEKRKMAFQEQLSSFKKQVRDQQEDHRRRFEESQRARRKEFDDIEYGRDERESRAIQDRQQEFEDAEKTRRKQTFEFRDTLLAAADNLNIQSRAQFEEWRGNVVEKVLVENLSRWERMFAEGPYSQTFLGGL